MKQNFKAALDEHKKEGNLILTLKGQVDSLKKGEKIVIPGNAAVTMGNTNVPVSSNGRNIEITRATVRAIQTAHNSKYKDLSDMFSEALTVKRKRGPSGPLPDFARNVLIEFFRDAPGFDQGYGTGAPLNQLAFITGSGDDYPVGLLARSLVTSLFSIYSHINNLSVPNPPLSTASGSLGKPLTGYMRFDDHMRDLFEQPRADLDGYSVVQMLRDRENEKIRKSQESGDDVSEKLVVFDNAGNVSAEYQLVEYNAQGQGMYQTSQGNMTKDQLAPAGTMYKEVVVTCTSKGTKESERFNPELFKHSHFLSLAAPMIYRRSELDDVQKQWIESDALKATRAVDASGNARIVLPAALQILQDDINRVKRVSEYFNPKSSK